MATEKKEEKLSLFKLNKDLQQVISELHNIRTELDEMKKTVNNLVGHVDTYNNHIKSLHM